MKSRLFIVLCVLVSLQSLILAQSAKSVGQSPLRARSAGETNPDYGLLSISNITTWHRSDGVSNHSPLDSMGGRYPTSAMGQHDFRGIVPVIYNDGLVWGGKVFTDPGKSQPAQFQPIRVGGSTYRSGTQPGWIEGSGAGALAADTSDPAVRVYFARNDPNEVIEITAAKWFERDYSGISSEMIDAMRSRTGDDWKNWPVDKGAPYIDRDGQPGYQPVYYEYYNDRYEGDIYDEPGIAGPMRRTPGDEHLWMVFNDLDTARTAGFAGSHPMGLEIQKTVWGYGTWGTRRDVYFTRYILINKGGVDTSSTPGFQGGSFWIDSMYVMQWSDPDLGSFSNDYLGCDTILHMGYAYNASDDQEFRRYGLGPAAVGYQVLVGPTRPSPGSEAIRNFRLVSGYENIGMTSFIPNVSGDFISEPPSAPYEIGTGRWWKLLRGFIPIGDISSPDQLYDPPPFTSFQPSPFVYSGDPVAGTGYINGNSWTHPGDQRMYMGIGPFTLAPGDTQEVIIATVAGIAADRLSSITAMKVSARDARTFAQSLFDGYTPPSAPHVRAIPLDGAVLLEWGSNTDSVARVETDVPGSPYAFEGYVVYRATNVTQWNFQRSHLATLDKVNGIGRIDEYTSDYYTGILTQRPLFLGNDRGLKRYMLITEDENEHPLINGHEYSFAVSAYTYCSDPTLAPRALESEASVVTVIPGRPVDRNLSTDVGDTLVVSHEFGSSTIRIIPLVIDPTIGTGDTYEVRFDTTSGTRTWSVRDRKNSSVVLSGQTNFTTLDDYVMIDGGVLLIVKDHGPIPVGPADVFSFTIPPPMTGPDIERENTNRIGVFPNPVYLTSDERLGRGGGRRVTFMNLPERVTIRIYNLAGHLVKTIRKESPRTIQEWDLTNVNNWLVASGMYIVSIEFPDLGTSKILKLAVIQGYPLEY